MEQQITLTGGATPPNKGEKMILTIDKLIETGAYREGKKWFLDFFKDRVEIDVGIVVKELLDQNKQDWANRIIAHLLSNDDKVRYAVFAAREVLHLYEEKYPTDLRPRKAIEAAENYLETKTLVAINTRYAINTAITSAAIAITIADSAWYAANAAADAVAVAAIANANAAWYAPLYAASAANAAAKAICAADNADATLTKIILHGLELLNK
jgi:hypothetical protein